MFIIRFFLGIVYYFRLCRNHAILRSLVLSLFVFSFNNAHLFHRFIRVLDGLIYIDEGLFSSSSP